VRRCEHGFFIEAFDVAVPGSPPAKQEGYDPSNPQISVGANIAKLDRLRREQADVPAATAAGARDCEFLRRSPAPPSGVPHRIHRNQSSPSARPAGSVVTLLTALFADFGPGLNSTNDPNVGTDSNDSSVRGHFP
jgi:hypothetical protein